MSVLSAKIKKQEYQSSSLKGKDVKLVIMKSALGEKLEAYMPLPGRLPASSCASCLSKNFCTYHYFACLGTNSSFNIISIPSASRFNVDNAGLAIPVSILLISD